MATENQEDKILAIPMDALKALEQSGAISNNISESLKQAASSGTGGDTSQLEIPMDKINMLVSSGNITIAQQQLILQQDKSQKKSSILGIPLNLTSILIIIGIGLIVISFGGLVAAIFDVAETRLTHVLLVSILMAIFLVSGVIVRRKLSLLAGELLVMGGIALTPWLVGAASTERSVPVGIVTATMVVVGLIGWNIQRHNSQIHIFLSKARTPLPIGISLILISILAIVSGFGAPLGILLIIFALTSGGYITPRQIGSTLILIAVAMTPAFLFSLKHAIQLPDGNWHGIAALLPSLLIFVLAYLFTRFFLYGLLISAGLVSLPLVLVNSLGYEPDLRPGSAILGLTAMVIVISTLVIDILRGNKGDSANICLWFQFVGLISFSGAMFAFLESFDNNAIFIAYCGACLIVLFGALRFKRITWTVIGLGSLGAFVVRLLVTTLGSNASYVLAVIGILLLIGALYNRNRLKRISIAKS